MSFFSANKSAATLALLCLLAALVVAAELLVPNETEVQVSRHQTEPADVAPSADLPEPAQPVDLPPLEHYSEIVERPLFVAGRRPEESVAEPVAEAPKSAAPAPKTKVKLTGIVLTAKERSALFYDETQKLSWRLTQGQDMEGWLLAEVQPDKVVLTRGDETQEMLLRRPRDKRPPPPIPKAGAGSAGAEAKKGLTAAERRERLKQKLKEKFKATATQAKNSSE